RHRRSLAPAPPGPKIEVRRRLNAHRAGETAKVWMQQRLTLLLAKHQCRRSVSRKLFEFAPVSSAAHRDPCATNTGSIACQRAAGDGKVRRWPSVKRLKPTSDLRYVEHVRSGRPKTRQI